MVSYPKNLCIIPFIHITSKTNGASRLCCFSTKYIKKQKIELHFNILDSPKFLNIRVLPDELKQKAEEDLSLFQKEFNVARIINYMNQESWSHHLKDFFEYTDLLDQSRNQTLNKALPEFSQFRPN